MFAVYEAKRGTAVLLLGLPLPVHGPRGLGIRVQGLRLRVGFRV